MNEKTIEIVKQIKKTYGNESIMILGNEEIKPITSISTGSQLINNALGIGGYPVGRIIEIFGPESSGKTTLALSAIAECQKAGGVAAFIDAENALDIIYAQNLGVNIDELILSQPDCGEEGLEIADLLIKSGAIDLVVVDSVAALVPKLELEGEMTDQTIGLQARLMSKALRKMAANINHSNATVIFINQLREKVGVIYGSNETTTGGRALKFYASIRLDIRKCELLKNANEIIGIKSRVKVVKNKVAPPFKVVEVEIIYGKGISIMNEIIELAIEKDLIKKAGSWYSYEDIKIGQGKEVVRQFLIEKTDILNDIKEKINQ